MWWVWLASKWWLFHVKHVWGHWGFGGGCPTEEFHNVEAILFIGFSALSPQYIPCSCCWNQLLKRLLNVLSNLVYGKFPHPYHARQFGCGCPTAASSLHFALSLYFFFPSLQMKRVISICSPDRGCHLIFLCAPQSLHMVPL